MQGCPFRCKYCQNPDTWLTGRGLEMSPLEVFREVRKYRAYFHSAGGGITVTGGEPLLQPRFVKELFELCHGDKIHTALDTSGCVPPAMAEEAVSQTDLVLLDLKSIDEKTHKALTGSGLAPVMRFAKWLSDIAKPAWIRHVVVPGYTDDDAMLGALADFILTLRNVELVELLPFHKLAEFKWRELGYEYELYDTEPPSPERMREIIDMFAAKGLKAR